MEKGLFRMIDAGVNRASEGLRVLEDLTRFYFNEGVPTKELKELRHCIRKDIKGLSPQMLAGRDANADVGRQISMELDVDRKTSIHQLAAANFKRTQEALRTVEESLNLVNRYELSKTYEKHRFKVYDIEKKYFENILCTNKPKWIGGLYCITSREHSKGRSNIEVADKMIMAGARIIQYREKAKKASEKYLECVKIRKMTRTADVTFIVNDNVDIAMMVGADGIHLGQDDLPITEVRKLVGENMLIGLSTHSPEQAQRAVKYGADYIGVGPIYRTYTKKDVCEPVGLEYLDYVVKNIDIPFVAIGGIKEHNMEGVLLRGAKCIAMVTEIVGSENIEEKVTRVISKISERGI